MTTPLRVLVVAASEDDALLLVRRLRSDGYDVTAERVDTAEALAAALSTATWDVVVSDYSIPHFSAIAALKILKGTPIDIPFIVVSGTAGEETAVDVLKAGAHDYVLKSNLARLAPAIRRELAEAEVRRAQKLATAKLAEHLRFARLRADVAAATTEGHELRAMLCGCTDAIVTHLGAAFARIWTLDREHNVLELQASSGLYTHIDGGHARVPVGQLKIGLIAEERRAHLTNDVLNDPRLSDPAWARREGMAAFAGYPLLIEDRLVGVMALFARQPLASNTLDVLRAVARVIAVDIDRRDSDRQLREALHRAEASDRLKNAFLDNMSHEIRTPLNVILGFNEIIAEELSGTGPESLHSWLAAIKAASHRLISTVDGILDMSKLQSRTFACQPRPVRLRTVVEDQIRDFRALAATRGLQLECEVPDPGIIVMFDEYCLSKILYALLDNACKFTPAGTVSVRVYRADAGRVRLEVADTGIGIAASELTRIWEPFSQVDDKLNTRGFEGAGLGLAVAQQFAVLNGSELTVRSEPQKGAVFTLELEEFGASMRGSGPRQADGNAATTAVTAPRA